MKQSYLLLFILFVVIFCFAAAYSEETSIKEIKYGRKDLLRNQLVLGVIASNNELFKQVMINNGYQIELLNSKIIELEKQLAECKANKKK